MDDGNLYVGTVSSGYKDPSRKGDINAIKYNLTTGELRILELHDQLECDDHDVPALLATEDGILALYGQPMAEIGKHTIERLRKMVP